MDALERYARGGETGDVALVVSAYAEDGVLRSPIAGGFAFRGHDDLRILMTEVYRVAKDPRFTLRALDGRTGMLTGTSRVWGVRLEEAFAFELDADGRVKVVTVHIRPWVGLTILALALGVRMARHPGVLWRAWRSE